MHRLKGEICCHVLGQEARSKNEGRITYGSSVAQIHKEGDLLSKRNAILQIRSTEAIAQSLIANRSQLQNQVFFPIRSLILGHQLILEGEWFIFSDA